MDNKDIDRLKKHILVLNKSYDNIVEVMEEDVEKKKDDDGNETIALKDDKIKTYADGIIKSAEALDLLLNKIQVKEKELSDLTGNKDKKDEITEVKIDDGKSNLSKHLK